MRATIFILLTSLFASCAYHEGMLQSDISLTNANFKVKSFVQGTSSTTLILGMGGLNKKSLIFEAKRDLYNNYQLQENEVFANFTVDQKTSVLPFLAKQRVTITAEVIEFTSGGNRFDKKAVDQLMTSEVDTYSFKEGDIIGVYDVDFRKGTIISIDGKKFVIAKDEEAKVHYIVRLHELYYSDVNSANTQRFGRQIGDEITFFATEKSFNGGPSTVIANKNGDAEDKLVGEIVGLNKNKIIVKCKEHYYKINHTNPLN